VPVRPTLRCLREDLRLPVPSARTALDQVDHPLLGKANEQFACTSIRHERIRSIDDVILFKVKVGRWRGAVFTGEPDAEPRDWLVAAGAREEGSNDDFYAALHAQARAARRQYNTELRGLLCGSLRDGHEHAADFPGFRLGVVVRADDGHETYVAIRITGSVPKHLTMTILSRVPGREADAWFPEYALPQRALLPAEQAWSNLMDPKAAAELLDSHH
jgi:hypothetical protein